MVVSSIKKNDVQPFKIPYMKKLILTACAALFCIGSIAQVQEQVQQGVDSTNQMDPASMDANAQPPMQEIEVLEDKEGPDNQVIYKYQGELYYVDREQKQLVKIEESQLKDAEHKAIEHNATTSGNEPEKNEQDKQ
jgi:hypothetical protein